MITWGKVETEEFANLQSLWMHLPAEFKLGLQYFRPCTKNQSSEILLVCGVWNEANASPVKKTENCQLQPRLVWLEECHGLFYSHVPVRNGLRKSPALHTVNRQPTTADRTTKHWSGAALAEHHRGVTNVVAIICSLLEFYKKGFLRASCRFFDYTKSYYTVCLRLTTPHSNQSRMAYLVCPCQMVGVTIHLERKPLPGTPPKA